ncbi:uncharacterized protein LOC121736370 isoform X5 [Aricia agestis]|uniref:uncharacterized protein LOC121736370 isoform X5 n=1 Tax=Aricia agestis TaxID=91739 RepID=UPI001C20B5A8|nr:uncharacterized protein LOC121736370 isoform X5 [Aricia agestis]
MPWNNSRNDFENALYDSQYPDENADGGVQLDHCRLYVTNLPKNLNEQGLTALFSKFGNIVKIHLSRDPTKRYAFVFFEAASQARVAMMKLNRTEPLKLNIAIAHKKNSQDQNENNNSRASRNFDRRSMADDYGSEGRSNNWNNSDCQNDVYEEELVDDELEMEEDLDLDVRLQMLNLKEAEIKLKKKILFLNQHKKMNQQSQQGNRSILPDGRIVVRNVGERAKSGKHVCWAPVQENFSSAADDSLSIPALQRDASCACVVCGAPAEAFCSRCGHTPYCGVRCQRADWNNRHRSVCHNLARLNGAPLPDMKKIDAEPSVPPAQPLRPPRPLNRSQNLNSSRDQGNDDSDSQKKYHTRDPRGPRERNNNQNYHQNNRNGPRNQNGRPNMRHNNSRPADEEESFETNSPKPLLSMCIPKPEEDKPESKTTRQPVKPAAAPEPGPSPKPQPARQSTEPAPVPKLQPLRQPAQEQPGPSPKPQPVKPAANPPPVVQETKITPKQYLPEALAMGSIMMLSLEAAAKTERPGFVCVALAEDAAATYQMLCEDYTEDCAKTSEIYKPMPGETFSYLNPEDGAWYRARCLNPTTAALIDAGSTVTTQPDNCRCLPPKYEDVLEFCCQLDAKGVQVGDNLTCTLVEKVGNTFKVSLARDGADIGTGEVFRWLPPVEKPAPSPAAVLLPEVSRPDVSAGSVVVVEGGAERTFVRAATTAALHSFSQALEDVLHAGMQGQLKPLKAPPQKGDMVVGKFTDGLHYRALCKRTNIKQNKYMLEYVEYGNIEISKLEDLYECPPEFTLEAKPTVVSMVKLQLQSKTLSEKAMEYLGTLRDDNTELTLSLTNGASSGPSGSEVVLTLKNESINRKLDDLSLPEWKKLEQQGVDIVDIPPMMISDVKYMELPASGEVEVLDADMFDEGTLSVCPPRTETVRRALADLGEQMEEYCNSKLGSVPYLPRPEELCIAKTSCGWIRGALCEQAGGAGGGTARVAPLDGGVLCNVPVPLIRKMLPDFMKLPALASLVDVRGFPKQPTAEQLDAARTHIKLDKHGQGSLRIARCERVEQGLYNVDAPELLKAMGL